MLLPKLPYLARFTLAHPRLGSFKRVRVSLLRRMGPRDPQAPIKLRPDRMFQHHCSESIYLKRGGICRGQFLPWITLSLGQMFHQEKPPVLGKPRLAWNFQRPNR